MFACLLGEVVKKYPKRRKELIALAGSREFLQAAQEYMKAHGTAGHVETLVKGFGLVRTWPKAA